MRRLRARHLLRPHRSSGLLCRQVLLQQIVFVPPDYRCPDSSEEEEDQLSLILGTVLVFQSLTECLFQNMGELKPIE